MTGDRIIDSMPNGPCLHCGNKTTNVVWMHKDCAVVVTNADTCETCMGRGWIYQHGSACTSVQCDPNGCPTQEQCRACTGTGKKQIEKNLEE